MRDFRKAPKIDAKLVNFWRYNEEKRLKNAAFEFMINKGIYVDFHEWLHNPARQPQSENIRGRFRMGTAATTRIAKFFGR